ncbi:MAG TPA: phytanoyl-CoA dioxygenase family protein [Vicinamibacterales bacterium]|nr:phytanoyl-CoA dioxygenase family protein [Vicinamibacterales bacterium]
MTCVIDALSSCEVDRTKAGARHVLNVPVVSDLASDPRMLDIARRFVGVGAVPFRATLFDKSSRSNWLVVWHQDTALPLRERTENREWGPWSVKAGVLYAHAPAWALERVVALRVSLDDSSVTNGPLRILPASHRRGVLSDAAIERLALEVEPVDCLAPSGSVVAMRPLIVHASSKVIDDQPRRVLHIEYADHLQLAPGLCLAVC